MKFRTLLFGLLLTFAATSRVSAQYITVPYDSIPIDSVFVDFQGTNMYLDSLQGAPDHLQAHLGDEDFFGVQFAVDHQVVTMDKDSVLQVYWSRVSTDSCAATIQFGYLDYSNPGPPTGPIDTVYEGGPLNVWHMTTLTVPDTGFNSLQIGVAVNGNAGQPGADSCFIDAIVLVQTGAVTAGVAQHAGVEQPALMNYPNPFYHASGTRVQVHTPVAGIGMLSVMDAIGREVMNVPLGALSTGNEDVGIALEHAGIYFVQLYVDGVPTGSPLEISGE